MMATKTNTLFCFLLVILVLLNVVKAALPENPKCEKICIAANRGCTNNCTKNGGDPTVCGSLCNDRYKGCFYKCLYDNKANCKK